jgi:hypothetical protein
MYNVDALTGKDDWSVEKVKVLIQDVIRANYKGGSTRILHN